MQRTFALGLPATGTVASVGALALEACISRMHAVPIGRSV